MISRFNLVLTSALLKPLLRDWPNPQIWSLMLTLCTRKHIQMHRCQRRRWHATLSCEGDQERVLQKSTHGTDDRMRLMNSIKAIINTPAIPVVTYSYCFNIINWKLSKIG